ncbi:MAG: GNAT family N-acetyltransferase [Candidatus Omnitrophica bacterium]|nr:GNAT family N-acetyltransferase [Candidatus Omnitrophota bacterium]MBU1128278.1 GNAT family N-acetyltransferase [Candidatus Omnitrophota bacterium]MBU1657211.1 GNAT family N-acetyltransferase [Candidatus Omnitrophota bacterium]MBU1784033.1 GNAT family N-acetyltransferase [Candidatus Omnitrophota bacterium]MBU1851028.1 GNAT family N-acetyltransferase [Candidatus Omnitrophota bacterium]
MLEIRGETDIDVCRRLWERFIPPVQLTDLWSVRECFHRNFKRELFFVTAKRDGDPVGFLPLSFIPERSYYGYFPGEVWNGKTWLEQNRVIVPNRNVLVQILNWLDKGGKRYFLRYLVDNQHFCPDTVSVDETGYLFQPGSVGFDIDGYYSLFSGKSIKKIKQDIDKICKKGVEIRTNRTEDFDLMVQMSLGRFGDESYFSDKRFLESFRDLKDHFHEKGWLRMTTVLIDGEPAAVDMGCVYQGVYTLLAGGTHNDYPGVAKVINLHHMKEACREKYEKVDFLCGDFSWKKIFHLSPNPLYKLCNDI